MLIECRWLWAEHNFFNSFLNKFFHGKYEFESGLPKIHEHDASPPKAYGIIIDGRLVCLYTHESDIGDGWEDAEVHNDSEFIRRKALQMGANILEYVFSN